MRRNLGFRFSVSLSLYFNDGFLSLQKQDYKMALRKYRKALRYLDICWEKEGIDEGIIFPLT